MTQYNHRNNLLSQLHMYLNRYGWIDDKKDIIREFTCGRTDSARILNINELRSLVNNLREQDPNERNKARWTRKLIFEFTQWDKKYCFPENRPNMDEINKYVLRHWKKNTVWSFTLKELPRIIAVLRKMNGNEQKEQA